MKHELPFQSKTTPEVLSRPRNAAGEGGDSKDGDGELTHGG